MEIKCMQPVVLFLAVFSKTTNTLSPEEYDKTEFPEFYEGCFWTLRVRNALCDHAGRCHQAELLAAEMQEQFFNFYTADESPPIDTPQWLLSVPNSDLWEIFDMCPGLVLTALLFDATLRLPVEGAEAAYVRFSQVETLMRGMKSYALETAFRMFPLELAINRFSRDLLELHTRKASAAPVVQTHYVVTRCRNALSWLQYLTVPAAASLHVYEKCDTAIESREVEFINRAFTNFTEHTYALDKTDGYMTGECSGYLQYIIDFYDELPDYVIFLHDDAYKHLKIPFLKILGTALSQGHFSPQVDFLHLNFFRVVGLNTRCMRQVYQDVFNEELRSDARLSTYCCGQFLVHRDAIRRRPREFYEDLLARLRRNWDNVCTLTDKPCYILEFLWQKVWRDQPILPERTRDHSLPIFARHDHNPHGFLPSNYSIWLSGQSAWPGL